MFQGHMRELFAAIQTNNTVLPFDLNGGIPRQRIVGVSLEM